jgi:Protein of unknown function DUF262
MNSVELSDVAIFTSDWTIETLDRYVSSNIINFTSESDHSREWDNVRKSRFIESLILGLPVPQLVIARDTADRHKFFVVDGRQRLSTISQFYDGELTLVGLEIWKELEGNTYDSIEFNPYLCEATNNLDACLLRVAIIKNWQDESLLVNIRSRLRFGYDN